MKTYTKLLVVSQELHSQIKKHTKEHGLKISPFIEKIIREYLNCEHEWEFVPAEPENGVNESYSFCLNCEVTRD